MVKGNVKYYSAADPDKLFEYVKEKEFIAQSIIPELRQLRTEPKGKVIVEVFEGIEGFKTLLNDIVKTGKDYVAYGIEPAFLKKNFNLLMEQFFIRQHTAGIKSRVLISAKSKWVPEYLKFKKIRDEFFSPTPIIVYEDKTASIIWEPFTIVIMKNKEFAGSYRKHFDYLWSLK